MERVPRTWEFLAKNKHTVFGKLRWNEYIPGDDTSIRVILQVWKDTIYYSEYWSVSINSLIKIGEKKYENCQKFPIFGCIPTN